MSKLNACFFYGRQSPFGMAHLKPISEHFNIQAIIVPSETRIKRFVTSLLGKDYYEKISTKKQIKNLLKKFIPQIIIEHKRVRQIRNRIHEVIGNDNIPILICDDVNSNLFIQDIKKHMSTDSYMLVAAYPQIFKREILDIFQDRAINFHPSLLPKYRGAHPHFWTIVNGEKETGLSAHYMTEGIDDGNIIAQQKILMPETYSELYDLIIKEIPIFFQKFVENLTERKVSIPQDDCDATYYRNDRAIHRKINWDFELEKIYNLCRTEYAFCFFRSRKMVIKKSSISKTNRNITNNLEVQKGVIVDCVIDALVVKTNGGFLQIEKMEMDNKIFNANRWINIYNPIVGERLT